jgi:hypothetical protein
MFVTIWRGGILFSRQKLRDALLQNRVRDFFFSIFGQQNTHVTSPITLTLSGHWNFFDTPPPPSGGKITFSF